MFSKNTPKSHFIKVLPVADQFCHADRRTDMTKLIVALRNLGMRHTIKDSILGPTNRLASDHTGFRLAFVLRTPI